MDTLSEFPFFFENVKKPSNLCLNMTTGVEIHGEDGKSCAIVFPHSCVPKFSISTVTVNILANFSTEKKTLPCV